MFPNRVHCGVTFRNEWAKSRLEEISDQKIEKYSIKLLAYSLWNSKVKKDKSGGILI